MHPVTKRDTFSRSTLRTAKSNVYSMVTCRAVIDIGDIDISIKMSCDIDIDM